jgi:hypothetical protein
VPFPLQLFCSFEGTAFLIRALAAAMQISVDDADDIKRRHKRGIAIRRRDMGEVIGFKRKKLSKFTPDEVLPSINLAEPITADKFPAWGRGDDTAPSE